MRAARLVLCVAAVVVATAARGQSPVHGPSPIRGSFELGAGNYTPDIDSDVPTGNLGGTAGPYEEMFGSGRGWMFRFHVARALYSRYGTFEVGFLTGFSRRSADAYSNSTPEAPEPTWVRSGDTTALNIIPTSLTLTYRFDWFAERTAVPLAPYARVSLERYNWWVSSSSNAWRQKGATNGWSATGGLALLLDFFDRGLARELENDSGINHTYLYADVTKSYVDDFGSKSSWDLSGQELMFSGGLLFVY